MTNKNNWKQITNFIIEFTRALRGGPGRFYAYTFGSGLLVLVGPPWWTVFIDYFVGGAYAYITGNPMPKLHLLPDLPPSWIFVLIGSLICLFSMIEFRKTIEAAQKNQHQIKGHRLNHHSSESVVCASAYDLQDLLEKGLALLKATTKTDYNQLFLISTHLHSKHLVCVASSVGSGKQNYRIAAFSGILGNSMETGRMINLPDVRSRENYLRAVIQTNSEIVVPVKIEDRVVGLINSESESTEYYSQAHEESLKRLADAIGENLYRVGWRESLNEGSLPWVKT